MPNQVFRLFVSSTFSDFQREREALQARVFPELERYCLVRGARFQAVDLRWGISEEAGRQQFDDEGVPRRDPARPAPVSQAELRRPAR